MGGGHTGLDSYTKMWQQRAPQASLRVVLQARVFRLWWPSGPQLWRLIITAPCRVRLGGGWSLSWGLLSPLHSFRELWAIFLPRPPDNSLANSAIPGLSHFPAHHPVHITN